MKTQNELPSLPPTASNLSKAIFTVNRHAKTATNPKYLYGLKKKAILKMITEGKAKKIGLHYSANPKFSQQQSDVLVTCGEYTFHIPPCKGDFDTLPHLGHLDKKTRNPKSRLNLLQAKKLLQDYTGMKETGTHSSNRKKRYTRPVFKPLGESFY
ncbi:hypothetical protein J2S13_001224 [Oikeobacillus pervagus]|uniref:YkyB-like protein n=1 Tax=Oikeobacillus pervagus TaxID=1325931 RepID=A0AAJ1T013_9BACI|nr:YkyB family protein [Oikeobacillus pervagus]MDQ0214827.1 hypothetical protein [Oikeobacillus pervagus]